MAKITKMLDIQICHVKNVYKIEYWNRTVFLIAEMATNLKVGKGVDGIDANM